MENIPATSVKLLLVSPKRGPRESTKDSLPMRLIPAAMRRRLQLKRKEHKVVELPKVRIIMLKVRFCPNPSFLYFFLLTHVWQKTR